MPLTCSLSPIQISPLLSLTISLFSLPQLQQCPHDLTRRSDNETSPRRQPVRVSHLSLPVHPRPELLREDAHETKGSGGCLWRQGGVCQRRQHGQSVPPWCLPNMVLWNIIQAGLIGWRVLTTPVLFYSSMSVGKLQWRPCILLPAADSKCGRTDDYIFEGGCFFLLCLFCRCLLSKMHYIGHY